MYRELKKILYKFRRLIFHPQWFIYKTEPGLNKHIRDTASGIILDIGCGEMQIKKHLVNPEKYIGLDYYQTSTDWYHTRPDVYSDAQFLPFPDSSIDTVLLLDVLEHIPGTTVTLEEIYRVLKPGGQFIIQTPFIYPMHDEPLDFYRWTEYGLKHILSESHFSITDIMGHGSLFGTSAVITNIAITKSIFKLAKLFPPFVLIAPFALLISTTVNLVSRFFELLLPQDNMMPFSYCVTCKKE